MFTLLPLDEDKIETGELDEMETYENTDVDSIVNHNEDTFEDFLNKIFEDFDDQIEWGGKGGEDYDEEFWVTTTPDSPTGPADIDDSFI